MADLMTLLVALFVMLLSFASTDVDKFRDMLGSVKGALGAAAPGPGAPTTAPGPVLEGAPGRAAEPELPPGDASEPGSAELLGAMQGAVSRMDLGRLVEVDSDERGVVVRVKGQMLFDSASAELRPESLLLLDEIARLAHRFPSGLSIEGHTDDLPIETAEFPTNWHLSADRAIAVLRYLITRGGLDPGRVSASGYADTRPLVANDSPGHRAMNRRVEFIYRRHDEPARPG